MIKRWGLEIINNVIADFSEDALIEQPAIALLRSLGWQFANCYDETFGPGSLLGRETSSEVILLARLRPALQRLNPGLPRQVLEQAVAELTRGRSTLSLVEANHAIYQLLKDGIRVTYRIEGGDENVESVRLVSGELNVENVEQETLPDIEDEQYSPSKEIA